LIVGRGEYQIEEIIHRLSDRFKTESSFGAFSRVTEKELTRLNKKLEQRQHEKKEGDIKPSPISPKGQIR